MLISKSEISLQSERYSCTKSPDLVAMRRLAFLLVACCFLLAGCDSSGPEAEPEAAFEAEFGAPVDTKLKGTAALGDGSSFEQGGLFTFTDPQFGWTITAIQLFGTDDEGVPHDLSFMYVDDERLGTGTYELNRPFEGGAGDEDRFDDPFPLDSLFTASYARRTTDSLFTYTFEGGSVTVETATESVVKGRFDLKAATEMAVHRDSLRAFIDSMRTRDRGEVGGFPEPPPVSFEDLESPMTVSGDFTATPDAFDDGVSHVDWLVSGRPVEF